MKLKKLCGVSFVGASLILTSLNAMAAAAPTSSSEHYGMAGCGFGGLVVEQKGLLPQIGAWFLNGLLANQSFAITSGTLNCVSPDKKMAATEQEVFINANLASLSKEAAQGDGEHIAALAQVFGCPHEQFAKFSQSHYKNIYDTNEPTSVLQNYRTEVNADQSLAKSCSKVI